MHAMQLRVSEDKSNDFNFNIGMPINLSLKFKWNTLSIILILYSIYIIKSIN